MKAILLTAVAFVVMANDASACLGGLAARRQARREARAGSCQGNEGGVSTYSAGYGCNGGVAGYGVGYYQSQGYAVMPSTVDGKTGFAASAAPERAVPVKWLEAHHPTVLKEAEAAGVVRDLPAPPPVLFRGSGAGACYYDRFGNLICPNG